MRIWRWFLGLLQKPQVKDVNDQPYYNDHPRQRDAAAASVANAVAAGMLNSGKGGTIR